MPTDRNAYFRQWAANNRDKRNAYRRAWYKRNRGYCLETAKAQRRAVKAARLAELLA